MEGKLVIGSFNKEDVFYTDVSIGVPPYDYEIHIRTSLEDTFEDIITKPYDFEESIEMTLSVVSRNSEDFELINEIKNNRIEYIKNANNIVFFYRPKEVAEFVKKNPCLKSKKIIFEDYFRLESKLLNEVSESFGEETSNVYFQISGNRSLITFKEYKDTIEAIEQIISDVQKFDFSPLEKIMYIYDIVRDKVYSEVDENEDKRLSRNLSSSLLGDKIVCLGYSTIFQTLIERLGFSCTQVILWNSNKSKGHARNAIYVKDKKYGIDGVYYFDPTWDSKKTEFDNTFLYSYKHFAITKKRMDKIDDGYFIEESLPYFSSNIAAELEEQINKLGFECLPNEMIKSVNTMSFRVGGDILINKAFLFPFAPESVKPNKEKVVKKVKKLVKYFNTPIPAEILLKVLYNVRKQQYYINQEKYPFGFIEFCKTTFVSNWEFEGTAFENFMLECATTPKEIGKIKVHQANRYIDDTGMYKNIQQVKLAKVLRNVCNKKDKCLTSK